MEFERFAAMIARDRVMRCYMTKLSELVMELGTCGAHLARCSDLECRVRIRQCHLIRRINRLEQSLDRRSLYLQRAQAN